MDDLDLEAKLGTILPTITAANANRAAHLGEAHSVLRLIEDIVNRGAIGVRVNLYFTSTLSELRRRKFTVENTDVPGVFKVSWLEAIDIESLGKAGTK